MGTYFAPRLLVVLAQALAFSSLALASELTEADAIGIAKAATVKGCTVDTPCKYYARRDGTRWYVQVQFTKRNSPAEPALPYPGGHEVLVLDKHGKILQTLAGE